MFSENSFAKRRAAKLNRRSRYIKCWKILPLICNCRSENGKTRLIERQLELFREVVRQVTTNIKENRNPRLMPLLQYVRTVCFDFTDNSSIMVDVVNWCMSFRYANEDF